MSLILEALRKSEAERRRGRMPDLHAELPPAPSRAATAAAWPWRIVLAAAALLALAAWLATSAWQPQAASVAAPPSTVAEATPTLPRVSHLQPMPQAQPAPARRSAETDPAQLAASARNSRIASPLHAPPVAADAGGASGRAAPPANSPSPERTQPVVAVPSSTPADTGAPVQLADLAPEERKALPPLRLSMHLWNDDPSRRFVILDGNRLGEGDRFGNLVVTAIVRDGVLLDWNGRVIKVPLR